MTETSNLWEVLPPLSAAAVSKANIEAVIALRSDLDNTHVGWLSRSYSLYDRPIARLLRALHANHFVQEFDFGVWFTASGHRYIRDPALLDSADLEVCLRLLCTHYRVDRLCHGWFGELVRMGHIGRILDRLAKIAAEI